MSRREGRIEILNEDIRMLSEAGKIDTSLVSDGYHTFGELYEHRVHLYINFCKQLTGRTKDRGPMLNESGALIFNCIRSKVHEDGLDVWNEWGMFLLCLHTPEGQISYHINKEYWDKCDFAETQLRALTKFDGHTSDDVLERLLKI